MNNLFLFEIIFFEISSSQYIVFNSKNVNYFVIIVILHDINFACLMNLFTMIIIMSYMIFVVKFFDFDSFVIKFNAMFWYDRFDNFKNWNLFICSRRSIFAIAHFEQFLMYFSTCFFNMHVCCFLHSFESFDNVLMFWCFWIINLSNDLSYLFRCLCFFEYYFVSSQQRFENLLRYFIVCFSI